MTMPSQDRNWISIAERASMEMDPGKLAILIKRLCCALDNRGGSAEDERKSNTDQIVAPSPEFLA